MNRFDKLINSNSKWDEKGFKRRFYIVVCLLILITTITFANSAIPEINPASGAVRFKEDSGISLVSEKLDVYLSTGRELSDYKIKYILKNDKEVSQQVEIWFVGVTNSQVRDENSFDYNKPVISDGDKKYEVTPVSNVNISNWEPKFSQRYIDPYDNQDMTQFIDERCYGENSYQYYSFTLEFDAFEEKELDISYSVTNGYLRRKGIIGEVNTQIYYLTPANFYNGQANLELNVYLKDKNIKFASNIPLTKMSKKHYQGQFNEIPKEELTFTMQDKSELIFGTNKMTQHSIGVIFSVIAIGFIGFAFYIIFKKNKIIMWVTILSMILGIVRFTKLSYGAIFMLTIMIRSPIGFGIGIIVLVLIFRKRNN